MRVGAGLFFLVALIAMPGMGFAHEKACTEIGCQNGLLLNVDPAYDWKNGNYDFEFLFDGHRVTCKGELPLKKCEDGPSFNCGSRKVTIGESGCALPKPQHGIAAIYIHDKPDKVLIRATLNGKPFLTRTMKPAYQESRPNGPGCGPVCTSATHNLFTAD